MGHDYISACTFIASDFYLPEVAPAQDYPLDITIDNGTIYDGGADDNYSLIFFENVEDYTAKKYCVYLDWHCTGGRAKQVIEYTKAALQKVDIIEFWHVWLMNYYKFEDRPFIHRRTISIDELTTAHIKDIDDSVIWNSPDKVYPGRPSFYCLTIMR